MENYYSAVKVLVATLTVCLLPISTVAQLRTPDNVPIFFLGKVIDQNKQPVQEAKVSLLIVTSHLEKYSTASGPVTIETDQNGNFEITGFVAHAIDSMAITKEGYELSKKTERTYVFGGIPTYTPDPNNPVVFKMWKQAGKEALIGSAWRGKVACDGTTNRFDLASGRPSADGDLEIICSKTPLTVPPPGNGHFDYKLQVIVIGGGLQTTEDEFTYLAAESSYSPSFRIAQKANDAGWKGSVKQEFYIKTSDARYGRLSVEWYAWQTPPTIFDWDCSINPYGSRNLER